MAKKQIKTVNEYQKELKPLLLKLAFKTASEEDKIKIERLKFKIDQVFYGRTI